VDNPEQYLKRARLTDDPREMQVEASDDVRNLIGERGGRLYLWVTCHGYCFGGISLLEADTQRPRDETRHFRRVRINGLELYLDAARRLWPQKLVLELRGHRHRVRAYWNDQAWVG